MATDGGSDDGDDQLRGHATPLEVHVMRILGATETDGAVEIRAVGPGTAPVLLRLPVEAAMALLNSLSRISRDHGWFTVT